MSFANRVVTCATMILTAAAIIGAGTPGFAQQLDRAINAPVVASVPEAGVVQAVDIKEPMASDELQDGDDVAFGTLDAAVAAQSVPDEMGDELQCMAGAIYFEAKGEPLSGQLAVAEVILNRSKSGHFPKSVCSVVTQPGQFSFVRGGHVPAVPSNRQYRTAVAVARVALADSWDSPAADAMYFHAKRAAPGWHRQQVAAIGNHVFYR
ncbi:cell wall hydrolase [Sphingomonas sp. TREG-RG-20F-R18-01]|uniref:cell wall hydrolase n=1 Tax=Sphingomonas sp. TREG-RG-20F-R18-01 TaxID=2914982 RepID=UPI001F56A39B|nr:cell wall hydrolase [Sphingomonas sp. TREG-RG-20F-R18-01]